ncbi:MAG TPA: cytochrome-c peroxidase [Planctomycetaceae bacterium]|nr:cytochrome-c peroxidase [Planctomycetaceae bacterium]
MTRNYSLILFSILLTLAFHCHSSAVEVASPRRLYLPSEPYRYSEISVPAYAAQTAVQFDNTPDDNPITDHGATLGRVLFYDKTLSKNGAVSCASCHKQELAFTDDAALSVGFDGRKVDRNSMSLVNSRFYRRGKFFWDERAETLEQQVLMPIENPIEMGHSLDILVDQLSNDPIYQPLFTSAFGDSTVTADRIAKALAQFVRSIVSFSSRYDEGRDQVKSVDEPFANFTEQENEGKRLFFGEARCATCHVDGGQPDNESDLFDLEFSPERQSAFFYMNRPVVNGIDTEPYEAIGTTVQIGIGQAVSTPGIKFDADLGAGLVTGKREDVGRFKSPSLRCVDVTGPYMHDGRFRTIEAVVEHYNWSIRPHMNLDPRLQKLDNSGIALPQAEVDALVAFLKTLTDPTLLIDPKYSDPFKM